MSYRVRVGPGAMQGDGTNRVQATYSANGATTTSNVATAKVEVIGGVFSDRGFILGKVFLDCNANGVRIRGEAGVPGVRLVIEDGTYVVTDGQGRYSFYGLTNRTHVLKVDATTLPAGARLVAPGHAQPGRRREPHRGPQGGRDAAAAISPSRAARARSPTRSRRARRRWTVATKRWRPWQARSSPPRRAPFPT